MPEQGAPPADRRVSAETSTLARAYQPIAVCFVGGELDTNGYNSSLNRIASQVLAREARSDPALVIVLPATDLAVSIAPRPTHSTARPDLGRTWERTPS